MPNFGGGAGISPEMLNKMMSDPDLVKAMQNPKIMKAMQEVGRYLVEVNREERRVEDECISNGYGGVGVKEREQAPATKILMLCHELFHLSSRGRIEQCATKSMAELCLLRSRVL